MQNTSKKTEVKEIFKSIQGEGPYIGYEQIFIRFCKCNLNCEYCDTDFETNIKIYSTDELIDEIHSYNPDNVHSISLTGGEPLLETEFLKEFLPKTKHKIYLETNGTLPEKLEEVVHLVDIISMDIKIQSSSKHIDLFKKHEDFIKISTKYKKEIFLKIVFDQNIREEEIKISVDLAKKYEIPIILQPLMLKDKIKPSPSDTIRIFESFLNQYKNVRLIPQVHKFLQVE